MMKKTLRLLAYSIFLGFTSYGQSYNSDSIINLLEGRWGVKYQTGGICGCKIEIEHPYDAQDVWFERHPTANDSVKINHYMGDSIVSGYSKVAYTSPSGWYFENWSSVLGAGSVKRYFSVDDTSLTLNPIEGTFDFPTMHYKPKGTQVFTMMDCEGSYNYQYPTPQPSDSVLWVLESGQIDFTHGSNFLNVKTSSNGAVILKKVYYNGYVATTSYVLNLPDSCGEKKYTLQGQVFKINNELWPHGVIYLYDKSQALPIDSVQFVNGSYLFTNVSIGTYTLYAVPYTDSTLNTSATDYVGTYYVNKKTLNDANTFDITENTYSVDLSLLTGSTMSQEDISINAFTAYPNPFKDQLKIEVGQDGASARVFNVQGSLVYSATFNQSLSLNTTDWKEGVYFIRLQTHNQLNTITLIKQ